MAWKRLLWGLIGLFVFVNAFFINIVVHEWGHYIAAEHYGLRPEIDYEFENLTGVDFSMNSVNVASTSFIDNGNDSELKVIAATGPFFNLVLGIGFLMGVIFSRKRVVRELLFIAFVISIASFAMNIIPFAGSDGSLLFGLEA